MARPRRARALAYYAVPDNSQALRAFRLDHAALAARAHASQPELPMTRERIVRLADMAPTTPHPAPLARRPLRRQNPRQEPGALNAHAGICAGGAGNGVPTATGRVAPVKLPNNVRGGAAEAVEGRRPAKGNAASETRPGRSAGQGASSELDRVRQVARKDKDVRFTALLHHVDVDRLRAAYRAIQPKAAPGVDGVTWRDYGQDLEANLRDLHARVHRGAYRARPSRRVYIPKPDGRLRPLGVAALEDKILQRAVVEVLNAIYEQDFLGFSAG